MSGPPDPATPPDEHPTAPGLYVHIPFCSRICPYCDFAVTPLGGDGDRRLERYRTALLRELELRAAPLGADTVYFGGGTPSLAPAGFFAEVVARAVAGGLAAASPFPSPFVVVEANPEDLVRDPGLAGRWAGEGVSGVSLGAQALDDSRLRFLGRAHRASDVRAAASRLAEAGIPWISLDLIYGTAGQTSDSLRRELRAAAALPGVVHVSAYELTIEAGTPFGRRAARGEDLAVRSAEAGDLFRVAHETLAKCGLSAYEASNFAADAAFRSRHNRKYWTGAEYLGVGPSAHSFAPLRAERSWNRRASGDWEAAVLRGEIPTAGRETLGPRERALEELFLRLRTTEGLDLGGFAARYGNEVVRANRARFRDWARRGLVRSGDPAGDPARDPESRRVRPTLEGLAVADALAREVDLHALRDRTAA